ncbi:MAG: insulinase family protein [Proteobacteria bacterium]|nr:insulinase family protein [Pseudomonadota bacterium]
MPATLYAADISATHEYRLQNGLKLIVKEDHRAPVVFSSIWYKVGSSYEPAGITGISHALEHMMFRGTHQFGPGKLTSLVNSNGGELNAMTSTDYTVFFQTLPADKLALSFQLESDRMTNLLLDKNAFSKEIQVVMEERRMRTEDVPQTLTLEHFNAQAFINNPYSHPVVGWMSDLQQMTIENLRAWYHQWYAPNNAILIVVGDVNPVKVYTLANQYFGKVPSQSLPVQKKLQEVQALGTRRVQVHIPAKVPWLIIGYNTPSLTNNAQSIDPYILTLIAYLLGGGESSRLNKDLVRGQQIAASASSDYDIYNLYSNLFTVSATPTNNTSIEKLLAAVQQQIQSLQTNLVDTKELARVKTLIISAHIYDQDSLMEQAFDLGVPEVTGLSWREENQFVNRIKSITPEQIRAAAQQYFKPEQMTVGVLDPIISPNAPSTTGDLHGQSAIH